jgi:hypothetical protein
LIAGALDLVSCSLSEAQILIQSGKVRALAVMSPERLTAFPDIPTMLEKNIDWQIGAYRGITTPVGVPEERLQILKQAVARVANSQEYLDFLSKTGAGHAALNSTQFRQYMARTDEEFGTILTGEAFANVEHKYGAMFFPSLLFGMLGICFVAYLITGTYRFQEDNLKINTPALIDIALVILCILFYIFLAEKAGFLITAALMMLILFRRLTVPFKISIPLTAILVTILYQLFAVYLRVPLPRAWIEW